MTTAHRATWNSARAVSGGDIMQGNYRGRFFLFVCCFVNFLEKNGRVDRSGEPLSFGI